MAVEEGSRKNEVNSKPSLLASRAIPASILCRYALPPTRAVRFRMDAVVVVDAAFPRTSAFFALPNIRLAFRLQREKSARKVRVEQDASDFFYPIGWGVLHLW